MRNKIRLDTRKDVQDFVDIAATIPYKITVTDGSFSVNGKSFLGMLYGMSEFDNLWVECENDVYSAFEKFIIIE